MKAPLIAAILLAAPAAAAATPPATPATPTPAAPLECAKGYAVLVAAAKAQPNASSVEAPAGSTMDAVSVQADPVLTVYNFTKPTHAAHPFITRRRMVLAAGKVSVEMSSCPYGDRAQSEMLEHQFKRMNDAFVRQISATPTS